MWQLILLHALFASTFTIGKAALDYVEPIFFVAMRALGCGLAFLSYQWLAYRTFSIKREHIWLFIQLGFFQIYCSFVLEFAVLRYIHSAKWALLYSAAPFITALFSYFQFGEYITPKKTIGFIIGFIGLIPVLFTDVGQENILGTFGVFSIPEIAILASMASYSYGWILSRRLVRDEGYSVALIIGVAMAVGGVLALITSPFMDDWQSGPIISFWPFVYTLVGIIASNVFVVGVNTYLLRFYTATFLVFLSFVDPLYVALYGWFFLGEIVSWDFFISVLGIFLGLYLFYQEELRQDYVIQ